MPEQPSSVRPHNLILEDRLRLSLSGVTDVESFNETEIFLYTSLGRAVDQGQGAACRLDEP